VLSAHLNNYHVAHRRILRLALGTSLSLAFSQIVNWPISFMAAVFTMFLLAFPVPAPNLKKGIALVLLLVISVYGSMVFIPFFEHVRWAGILLLIPALYGCFYYTARGGSMIVGMFMTIGLTLVVTVGSVSIDGLLLVARNISICMVVGLVFVWIAHALLPDISCGGGDKSPPQPSPPAEALVRRSAFRSLVTVFPLVLVLLFSSASFGYIAVILKVISMGQQASVGESRRMGRSLIESTLWGGLAAIIAWQVLSIWPSLLMYCLLIALAGLLFGRYIFQGSGRHPVSEMAIFAFLTMVIILAPALLDGQIGSDASTSFYDRLLMFLGIAFYGTVSVTVFDAFWPQKQPLKSVPGQ